MSGRRKRYVSPIQSMDFYLESFQALCKKLKLENDLSELTKVLNRDLSQSVIALLQDTPYQALVATDSERKIVWANNGFHEMTGYNKQFAIGQHPSFLQGKNTSAETKNEIRELLKQEKRFSTAIVNYKKNGEEYRCHIDVIPLLDGQDRLTHYLAMERELIAA